MLSPNQSCLLYTQHIWWIWISHSDILQCNSGKKISGMPQKCFKVQIELPVSSHAKTYFYHPFSQHHSPDFRKHGHRKPLLEQRRKTTATLARLASHQNGGGGGRGQSLGHVGSFCDPAGSSWAGDRVCVSCDSCSGSRILYYWASGKPLNMYAYT